jgi:hypothetical protein
VTSPRRVVRLTRWLERERERLHRDQLVEAVVSAIVANNNARDIEAEPAAGLRWRQVALDAVAADLRAAAAALERGDGSAAAWSTGLAADRLATLTTEGDHR